MTNATAQRWCHQCVWIAHDTGAEAILCDYVWGRSSPGITYDQQRAIAYAEMERVAHDKASGEQS